MIRLAAFAWTALLFMAWPCFALAETVESDVREAEWSANYSGEWAVIPSGGVRTGSVYLGVASLEGALPLDFLGWRGVSLQASVLAPHGNDPSEYAGDIQAVSNIEASSNTIRLYEALLKFEFPDRGLSLFAGLYDLNSEFYSTESSAPFLNSSFGIGLEIAQTGSNGPSVYPVTAPGARVRVQAATGHYFQAAILDAVPGEPEHPHGTRIRISSDEGILAIAEAGWTLGDETQPWGTKAAFGVWRYSERFDHLTATDAAGVPLRLSNSGSYILVEQPVGAQGALFVRYGVATEEVNPVGSNLAVGFVRSHEWVRGQGGGLIGFGVTSAFMSTVWNEQVESGGEVSATHETALEATLRWPVTEKFALQPDIQYVLNPGGLETDAVWVGLLRFDVSY